MLEIVRRRVGSSSSQPVSNFGRFAPRNMWAPPWVLQRMDCRLSTPPSAPALVVKRDEG